MGGKEQKIRKNESREKAAEGGRMRIRALSLFALVLAAALLAAACGESKETEGSILPADEQAGEETESAGEGKEADDSSPAEDQTETDAYADESEHPDGSSSQADGFVARPSSCGALQVTDGCLTDCAGNPVQLRGISTHGLSWYPDYVNAGCFSELAAWGADVVRLALYTEETGGYCAGGDKEALKALIRKGVQYAADADLYVILDWHILSDGDPLTHLAEAEAFFSEMSAEFASLPNVIYEICNEPNGTSWEHVKTYAEEIIPVIRANAPDALILVGTPDWCQALDAALSDPLPFDNILYTLHFYAASHKESLRDELKRAAEAHLPVFVSEFGLCEATGDGSVDSESADAWIRLMDSCGVSYVAWNLSNKAEASALIRDDVTKTQNFTLSDLTESGQWVYDLLTGHRDAFGGDSDLSSERTDPGEEPDNASAAAAEEANASYTDGISVTVREVNHWQSEGRFFAQYKVTVRNTSDEPVPSWETTLDLGQEFSLTDSWNGIYTADGTTLTIRSRDYNGSLPAGGAAEDVGFIVSGSASFGEIRITD